MNPMIGITAEQYILLEQHDRFPDASGEFSWLLSGITLACKIVASAVRRAGLNDVLGATDHTNVQGEIVQKLDQFANQTLIQCLGSRGNVGVLASEENEEPVVVMTDPEHGKYIVVFDPLDGSGNIDVNVSVGTIFSILRRDPKKSQDPTADVLQPGYRQIAAGYVLYGSSTMLVYTTGGTVNGFTLDPSIGAFILSHPNIRIPNRGKQYSVNEANLDSFPEFCRKYLYWFKSGADNVTYTSRYVGSLVADFHRILLQGGIFLYPSTAANPQGKLRLMYEANPIAFVAEQAGGLATTARERILEIVPQSLHQRTPLMVGSKFEMEKLHEFASQPRRGR
jgi:fructose-1,6-bisphosphatase I